MPTTSSSVRLQPGIYILRYPAGSKAPLSVTRAPGLPGDGKLATLGTDNTQGTILRDGSDCIVLHVSLAPVELLVTAFLDKSGDPVPTLRLDQIGLDAPAAPAAPLSSAPAQGAPIPIGPHGITLIGHIERSGDLVAAPGTMLGDPLANLRLEGFQVVWPDRPDGIDLAYGLTVEGVGRLPVVNSGRFCGSRGSARRITEVMFTLVGPDAARYRLTGTACFSGGFESPVASGIPLGGPSGVEHLVALSLRATAHGAPSAARDPWAPSARTTVFKAAPAAPAPRTKSNDKSKKPA